MQASNEELKACHICGTPSNIMDSTVDEATTSGKIIILTLNGRDLNTVTREHDHFEAEGILG